MGTSARLSTGTQNGVHWLSAPPMETKWGLYLSSVSHPCAKPANALSLAASAREASAESLYPSSDEDGGPRASVRPLGPLPPPQSLVTFAKLSYCACGLDAWAPPSRLIRSCHHLRYIWHGTTQDYLQHVLGGFLKVHETRFYDTQNDLNQVRYNDFRTNLLAGPL